MEDAVLLLLMLFVLVMASYLLGRYSCMLISQSSFALMFGLFVGLFMIMGGKHASLHTHLNLDNSLFFNVLLPPIIYEGGFSVKSQVFFRNFPAIMSTAVIGTAIATTITGGVLYLAGLAGLVTKLSWVEAFLFGTLISAVDTVATLSCFDKLNAPPLLFNLVFGESVMNDAVAIALYQTLKKWDADIDLTFKQLVRVALNTGGMFVGSLLVSAVITLGGAFLLKRQFFATLRYYPSYEISLCLIFSLLTYFVADSLKLSGIVALFFSGTMTAHYHFNTLSKEAQHAFTHLLHTLAFVCENIVYVFMGTSVIMIFAGHAEGNAGTSLRVDDIDWSFIGLTLVACLVARFMNIFPLLSLCNCLRSPPNRIPVKYMSVIWFAGLRGSMAFALAKNWSYVGLHGASHRRLIESTTLVVILITTIVVGGLTGPFLSSLRLTGKYKEHNHLDQTDTESNSGVVSDSDEVSQLVQRSTRHAPAEGEIHGSLAFPEEATVNRDADGNEVPVFTPRPQFHDAMSDDDEDPNLASPVRRAADRPRGESLTGAFFRNWQAFDTTYMQPAFGGKEVENLCLTDAISYLISIECVGMAPPNGKIVETNAPAAGSMLQTSSSDAVQPGVPANEIPAAPESSEMSPSESANEETDEMVEALENLILEAYSSMQSDGEYIFLPDEVAEKLHRLAGQMGVEAEQEGGEILQKEDEVAASSAGQDSGSGDATIEVEETVEVKEQQPDRPEPEQEQEQELLQEKQEGKGEDEEARLRKVQALQIEAAELREEKQKQRIPRMKEDKKKRELRIREDARKQREDAKRKLEKAHQKDMEEKRERVKRIREERLHRKAAAKGTKKA
ncbi:hypothetical protein BBJ29_007821 [Phytophthora kernoviae]|uniref:Cation/H+ exchanger transmembrane domain-containing protein n=1 Tax=Phytophthora kernoviae TaxID=325452 RepID=A0A3F2RLJ9_9STRA|nr:hypothetical protein BBJ29_007821 [Phytophthora kernoviae]RLN59921.1 hypothetical protein BBP00_00006259 [Phytophthora kernoviae]